MKQRGCARNILVSTASGQRTDAATVRGKVISIWRFRFLTMCSAHLHLEEKRKSNLIAPLSRDEGLISDGRKIRFKIASLAEIAIIISCTYRSARFSIGFGRVEMRFQRETSFRDRIRRLHLMHKRKLASIRVQDTERKK